MIVYIGKYPLKMEGLASASIKKEMKNKGIVGVFPFFEDKDKAIEFLGDDGYLMLSRE